MSVHAYIVGCPRSDTSRQPPQRQTHAPYSIRRLASFLLSILRVRFCFTDSFDLATESRYQDGGQSFLSTASFTAYYMTKLLKADTSNFMKTWCCICNAFAFGVLTPPPQHTNKNTLHLVSARISMSVAIQATFQLIWWARRATCQCGERTH